jgi:hypothetical protein
VAAIVLAYLEPDYAGLGSKGERMARTAPFYLFGAYVQTMIFGLPAFFILRKCLQPTVWNCVMVGSVIAAAPWLALGLLSHPDYAYVGGHVTVLHGQITWQGLVDLLELTAKIAASGTFGGLVFWFVAAFGFAMSK